MSTQIGDVVAVFSSRREAEAAVDELRSQGLAEEHLVEAVHGASRLALPEDTEREAVRAMGHGMLIGLPIGSLVGALIVALAQSLAGVELGWATIAAGGYGGFMGGLFFGTFFGLVRKLHLFEEEEHWVETPIGPNEILVVAHPHHWAPHIRDVFERHGGRPPMAA